MDEGDDGDGRWYDLGDASSRLGVPSVEALRKRIQRNPGAYLTRRMNDGRLQVWLSDDVRPGVPPARPDSDTAWLIASLLPVLTSSWVQADAERRRADDLTTEIARVRAESEAHIADLRAEVERLNAELARRRWPGLKAWWRRLIDGES